MILESRGCFFCFCFLTLLGTLSSLEFTYDLSCQFLIPSIPASLTDRELLKRIRLN